MNAISTLPGVLLSQGAPDKVTSWLGRGTVPGYVLPLGDWTAVVPAGPSQAAPPYDDALAVLAARPVPRQLCTAVGFFAVDGGRKAVVVVRPRSPRGSHRWLAWMPERGAVQVPQHEPANVRDLLDAAGLAPSERRSVLTVLARREGACRDLLVDLIDALGLPGAALLRGSGVGAQQDATLVRPDTHRVDRFDRDVHEASPVSHDEGNRS